MKVGKKILNFIFVLVIALSFTFIGVKSVVFKTIFNKEYVLEQMEKNNFYSETYKLVESGFENYIGQSGLDEEVIKNICTEDKIKNDINIILSNIGPKIPVKLNMVGDILTDIETKVTDYGINNVVIEVIVKVEVYEQVILPFGAKKVTINTDIPIALKLIQGEIPSYFFNNLKTN